MLAALRPQLVNLVPVETLIVDEASQIPLGDYLYAFHTFASTLRRVCFIGDDKQREFCELPFWVGVLMYFSA